MSKPLVRIITPNKIQRFGDIDTNDFDFADNDLVLKTLETEKIKLGTLPHYMSHIHLGNQLYIDTIVYDETSRSYEAESHPTSIIRLTLSSEEYLNRCKQISELYTLLTYPQIVKTAKQIFEELGCRV